MPSQWGAWEIYALEANSYFHDQLMDSAIRAKSMVDVKDVHVLSGVAIGNYDGTASFILDGLEGNGSAGSTLSAESHSAIGRHVNVTMIDIKTLITKTIKARKRDFLAIKMDVSVDVVSSYFPFVCCAIVL